MFRTIFRFSFGHAILRPLLAATSNRNIQQLEHAVQQSQHAVCVQLEEARLRDRAAQLSATAASPFRVGKGTVNLKSFDLSELIRLSRKALQDAASRSRCELQASRRLQASRGLFSQLTVSLDIFSPHVHTHVCLCVHVRVYAHGFKTFAHAPLRRRTVLPRSDLHMPTALKLAA